MAATTPTPSRRSPIRLGSATTRSTGVGAHFVTSMRCTVTSSPRRFTSRVREGALRAFDRGHLPSPRRQDTGEQADAAVEIDRRRRSPELVGGGLDDGGQCVGTVRAALEERPGRDPPSTDRRRARESARIARRRGGRPPGPTGWSPPSVPPCALHSAGGPGGRRGTGPRRGAPRGGGGPPDTTRTGTTSCDRALRSPARPPLTAASIVVRKCQGANSTVGLGDRALEPGPFDGLDHEPGLQSALASRSRCAATGTHRSRARPPGRAARPGAVTPRSPARSIRRRRWRGRARTLTRTRSPGRAPRTKTAFPSAFARHGIAPARHVARGQFHGSRGRVLGRTIVCDRCPSWSRRVSSDLTMDQIPPQRL